MNHFRVMLAFISTSITAGIRINSEVLNKRSDISSLNKRSIQTFCPLELIPCLMLLSQTISFRHFIDVIDIVDFLVGREDEFKQLEVDVATIERDEAAAKLENQRKSNRLQDHISSLERNITMIDQKLVLQRLEELLKKLNSKEWKSINETDAKKHSNKSAVERTTHTLYY